MKTRFVTSAAAAALVAGLVTTAAHAATEATASTDLNLRAGPGPVHEVIGLIPADAAVTVEGCIAEANWCQVTHEGVSGWAFGDYLTTSVSDQPMALTAPETRATQQVATVTYTDTTDTSVAGGTAFGVIAGALIGGPVGAAAGAVIGATAGAAADPGPQVTTYVTENPVEPVYLDGEVVVGAGIPAEVTLTPVPDSPYAYTYVNGQPVIVEMTDRRIVTIVR